MRYDDIIIGAGHNGLTAAAYLARAGRTVLVLERSDRVGGAAVSARAFDGVDARLSRYSYLVSLLPRQVLTDLDLDLRLIRRRFSSYTPVPSDPDRGLLVDHGDAAATRAAFRALTGGDDAYAGWTDFYARMAGVAERVFPTVLEPLRSRDDVRALSGDADLFDALTTRPVGELIESVTERRHAPRHHRHRRPHRHLRLARRDRPAPERLLPLPPHRRRHRRLGRARRRHGCAHGLACGSGGLGRRDDPHRSRGHVGRPVHRRGRVVRRETPGSGSAVGGTLVAGCAPTVLNRLLAAAGADPVDTEPDVEGAQLKVNMLLTRLPRLRDASVDPAAAFAGTFHINEGYGQLEQTYAAARDGRIPDLPPCEIYCHTLSDRSILGPELAADATPRR